MKVLFTIWTYNEGIGGHYQSFISTLNSLDKSKIEYYVINLGNNKAISLYDKEFEVLFYQVSIFNQYHLEKKLKKIIELKKIDVVHCYDYHSYFFVRKASLPILVTYPGGSNNKWFPIVENALMFSQENYHHFSKLSEFKKTRFYLLTNRVDRIFQDNQKIKKILAEYKSSGIVLLKVARIGKYYENSIQSSIDIATKLFNEGIDNTLFIIGYVEDENVRNQILNRIKNCKNNIHLLTNKYYTSNANSLIQIADILFGTGRGIMEGLSFGKIVLSPVNNGNNHVVVNEDNINFLEFHNFSERAIIKDFEDLTNQIRSFFVDSRKKNNYTIWAQGIFGERYSTVNITPLLINIYNSLQFNTSIRNKQIIRFSMKIFRFIIISSLKRLIVCIRGYSRFYYL